MTQNTQIRVEQAYIGYLKHFSPSNHRPAYTPKVQENNNLGYQISIIVEEMKVDHGESDKGVLYLRHYPHTISMSSARCVVCIIDSHLAS